MLASSKTKNLKVSVVIPAYNAEGYIEQVLDAVQYLEVTRPTWVLVGKTSAELRRKGIKMPISDLVICAIAIETGSEILTSDSHFDHIPELKHFSDLSF